MEQRVYTMPELFGGLQTDPVRDPYLVYRRLRDEAPVLPLKGLLGLVYVVTRYDDVKECLRNDVLYSNRSNARQISLVMGRTIIEMDGREHLKHRNIVTPALAPRALKGDFPAEVESIAHEQIDRFAGSGTADLVEEFTFSYPLRVFTRILGLPMEDYDQVHHWSIDLTKIGHDPAAGLAASQKLADYFRPIVAQRKVEPANDLLSKLVHAEIDGERMTEEEVISFLRLLVIAGAETTYHLIGSALVALLNDAELLEEVRADRSLIMPLIEETLRWESPIQTVTREVTQPVEIAGVELPAGAHLLVAIGSANRDERQFDDPDRFDIRRPVAENLAFGFGKHYCAGSRLAYLEARVALETLLDRLPNLRLQPGETCKVVGLAFRGPDRLPVAFDTA